MHIGHLYNSPVFTDEEDNKYGQHSADTERKEDRKKEKTPDKMTAETDLGSRIEALRRRLSDSVQKTRDLSSLRTKSLQEDRTSGRDSTTVRKRIEIEKERESESEDDTLSLKPYLLKGREKLVTADLGQKEKKLKTPAPASPDTRSVISELESQEAETRKDGADQNVDQGSSERKEMDTSSCRQMGKETESGTSNKGRMSEEECRMAYLLEKLRCEERMIEEENRRIAEEEAYRRERLDKIRMEFEEKEEKKKAYTEAFAYEGRRGGA